MVRAGGARRAQVHESQANACWHAFCRYGSAPDLPERSVRCTLPVRPGGPVSGPPLFPSRRHPRRVFRPLTLFVAWRYLRARRRNRFTSLVSAASLLGIALAVAALVIVLSVMNGFEREVTRHVLGMTAHAVVVHPGRPLADWQTLDARLQADASVRATAPYVRASGMLSHRGEVRGVVVEGLDPDRERAVTSLERYVTEDALALLGGETNRVLLGASLATALRASPGDTLTLVVPAWDAAGRALAPRYERLVLGGTFHVGMQQFDAGLVLMDLPHAQRTFALGDAVSGVRLRFASAAVAPVASRALVASVDPSLGVIDWTQYHRNFFLALASQKRIMFVILVLIIAVAAFNIAANMTMVVTEKTRDIAILRTMGASRRAIVVLFLLQGALLGLAGTALGALLGAWGAAESNAVADALERLIGVDLVNADVYFIDYLPAELRVGDVGAVTLATLALAVLATVYPALRAASVDPARAIQYD